MKYLLTTIAILATAMASTAQQWRVDYAEYFSKTSNNAPYTQTAYAHYYYNADNNTDKWNRHEQYGNYTGAYKLNAVETRSYNKSNDPIAYVSRADYNDGNGMQVRSMDSVYYVNGLKDSIIQYTPGTAGQLHVMHASKYLYDANGREHVWLNYFIKNGVSLLSKANYYSYDANGNMVADSAVTYNYNNGVIAQQSIVSFGYDAVGNNNTRTFHYYRNGVKSFGSRTYYYYNANNLLIGDSVMTRYNGQTIDRQSENIYYRDASGKLIEHLYRMSSNTNGVYVLHRTRLNKNYYDATGNIVAITRNNIDYDDNIMQYDSVSYRFQHYWPLNTTYIIAQQNDLIAYPVPSSNFINLKWQADKSTTINARLVNLQGQVVKQWSDDAEGAYTKSIHVGDLPTGNYYIILEADGNTLRKQISIQR